MVKCQRLANPLWTRTRQVRVALIQKPHEGNLASHTSVARYAEYNISLHCCLLSPSLSRPRLCPTVLLLVYSLQNHRAPEYCSRLSSPNTYAAAKFARCSSSEAAGVCIVSSETIGLAPRRLARVDICNIVGLHRNPTKSLREV